jgi:hypothetical protein
MQNQPFFSPEIPEDHRASIQGRRNVFQRVAQGWLRFSGPNKDRFSSSLEDQERLRRSRVLSAVFLLLIVALLIEAPIAFFVPTYWIPVVVLLVLGTIALLFNRAAYINLSGLFTIFAIDATLTILMVTLPHGIRNSNIPDFDLFVVPILIAGIVLPRRLLPFLVVLHCGLILSIYVVLPHDPLLIQEIHFNQKGFAYAELSDAFLLQIAGGLIAWINAWSVDKALVRASKAEDLAGAQRRLNAQAQFQVEQKERLEYGIAVLKDAHARFANGDYKARANLQNNELASLAFSFNLLAERLNRVAHTAQEYIHLEQAFQQLFAIQTAVVYGGSLQPLMPTGTLVDKIYPWLKQYYQFRQAYSHCLAAVEQMRLTLTHQRTLLAQLTSALDQAHADVRLVILDSRELAISLEPVEKAQHLCKQAEEQEKLCLQQTKQLDRLLKI